MLLMAITTIMCGKDGPPRLRGGAGGSRAMAGGGDH
jgi:hypothetical protein